MNSARQAIFFLLPGLLVVGASFSACKGELEEEKPKAKVEKKSNIVRIKTAVAPGKQLSCAEVFPDLTVFSEKMMTEVGSIKDKSKSNSSTTMVCSMIRAGEPPESPKELKTLEEKYAKLGVLPGDSFCQITAHCSIANDEAGFKKKCKADGHQETSLDGDYACLRVTEKGPEYSYTYKFIEPDTKCIIEVLAGPSVVDQELVKNCASAARTAITKESTQNAK